MFLSIQLQIRVSVASIGEGDHVRLHSTVWLESNPKKVMDIPLLIVAYDIFASHVLNIDVQLSLSRHSFTLSFWISCTCLDLSPSLCLSSFYIHSNIDSFNYEFIFNLGATSYHTNPLVVVLSPLPVEYLQELWLHLSALQIVTNPLISPIISWWNLYRY